jgi:hypothetical protein
MLCFGFCQQKQANLRSQKIRLSSQTALLSCLYYRAPLLFFNACGQTRRQQKSQNQKTYDHTDYAAPTEISPKNAADRAADTGARVVKEQIQRRGLGFVMDGKLPDPAAGDGMAAKKSKGKHGDSDNFDRQAAAQGETNANQHDQQRTFQYF